MPQSQITIVGNLASDPDLRYTQSGVPVARLRVAVANRFFNSTKKEWEERNPDWYSVNVWRALAENCAESLTTGSRVIVTGTMHNRSYETAEGETKWVWELEATDVGAALTFASVKINKAERQSEQKDEVTAKRATKSGGTSRKPAGKATQTYSDEPPF